jgi:predicted DNA-binding transcriptional regulator YafY
MKTDRLIALMLCLLNHETVSAEMLAKRFEVSKRTIVRDVQALCQAGVPIVSLYGAGGGYRIEDGFKVLKQITGPEDWRNMVSALRGLDSAVGSRAVKETLDKAVAARGGGGQRVFLDLGAGREDERIEAHLRTMERAIAEKRPLVLEYLDARGTRSQRVVEPVALSYQWYAWYLAAFCTLRQGYRLFKLPRVLRCEPAPGVFSREHGSAQEVLEGLNQADVREVWQVRLLIKGEARQQAEEYLKARLVEEKENGDAVYDFCAPFERMWFSLLLGFGDRVQVLEPEELQKRLRNSAREVLALYGEGEVSET